MKIKLLSYASLLFVLTSTIVLHAQNKKPVQVKTLLITHVQLIDGTGKPSVNAAVRIQGNKIIQVGQLKPNAKPSFRQISEQAKKSTEEEKIKNEAQADKADPVITQPNAVDVKKVTFDLSAVILEKLKNLGGNFSFTVDKQIKSPKFMSALKGWVESSKFRNNLKPKSTAAANNEKNEAQFEMDRIKSFDSYFIYNNIESILEKMEVINYYKNKRKLRRHSPAKVNVMKERTLNLTDGSLTPFVRGSVLFNKEEGEPNINHFPKNTIMRKNFFKNAPQLEKLLQEELFDPNKIKEYYKNKYLKEDKKGIRKFFRICIIGFFKLICSWFYKGKTRTLKKLSYLNEKNKE